MTSRRSGFTILELIISICILGILLALAAPRYTAYRDQAAARSAADEVGSALVTARETAITKRTAVSAYIDTARRRVLVRTAGRELFVRSLGMTYGVSIASNRDSLVYDSHGIGYGASNLTIVIRRGAAAESVVVSRLGRVRW